MGKDNSLFLWMEDFDNPELSREEWVAHLESAVREYNRSHGTNYDPRASIRAYEEWISRKTKPDM